MKKRDVVERFLRADGADLRQKRWRGAGTGEVGKEGGSEEDGRRERNDGTSKEGENTRERAEVHGYRWEAWSIALRRWRKWTTMEKCEVSRREVGERKGEKERGKGGRKSVENNDTAPLVPLARLLKCALLPADVVCSARRCPTRKALPSLCVALPVPQPQLSAPWSTGGAHQRLIEGAPLPPLVRECCRKAGKR